MNTIESTIQSIEQFQNASLIKIFKSKKNTVCLIELNQSAYVLKLFSNENISGFQNELMILFKSNTMYNKAQMKSFDEKNKYILLEYVKGENVCDFINNPSIPYKKKTSIIQELARWFNQFHDDLCDNNLTLIHGDANLRNFLYTNIIIGLDFEETINGKPSQDIANICASILTTNPQFTKEKEELKDLFIQSYQKLSSNDLSTISEEIEKTIQKIKKRRKKRN